MTIKGLNDRCLLCAVSPACGKNLITAGLLHFLAASFVCGKNLCQKKCCFRFQSGILLCVGKTDGDFYILLSTERYPPARGEDPSKSVVRFPVTKVPVSTIVALHSKVLRNLHGRMSSGPPQPYFVEILRRGDNTAVGDEYFNRRVSLSFNIHLRYLLCVGKTASAYCSTNSTIVAVFFVYGKSSVDAVRFPSQEFPFH